jgi:hypothetical protein
MAEQKATSQTHAAYRVGICCNWAPFLSPFLIRSVKDTTEDMKPGRVKGTVSRKQVEPPSSKGNVWSSEMPQVPRP